MTREQYLNQRNQLMNEAKGFLDAGNIEQFNATKAKVEALDQQYQAQAEAQANYAALQGGAVVPAQLQNLGGQMPAATPAEPAAPAEDLYDSAEYKTAFMNHVCRNAAIPAKFRNAAAVTTAEGAAAAIPTTYLREIIRGLKERGVIFQQMRQLNIAGGVEIPIADLAPVASWVGETASEDQKVDAEKSVSFKYYGLECKIAQTILASVVTIEEFQQLFVELAIEAIMAAIEKGAFHGTGNKQMLGVCNDPRVTKVAELTEAEMGSWKAWKQNVFSLIPKKYQNGSFYMAQGTFEGYIDGMVDISGQPIGRTNYGIAGAPQYSFGGKKVETTEDDVLTPWAAAAEGEVVAVYMNMKNYLFNSNMEMTVVHWTDHDNNKKKVKVMLICDGKAGDVDGIILVKKKAAAAAG